MKTSLRLVTRRRVYCITILTVNQTVIDPTR